MAPTATVKPFLILPFFRNHRHWSNPLSKTLQLGFDPKPLKLSVQKFPRTAEKFENRLLGRPTIQPVLPSKNFFLSRFQSETAHKEVYTFMI